MAAKGQGILNPEDLKLAWKVVVKNWYIFILIPVLAFFLARIYTYQLTDVYAAKVQILLKSDDIYDYQQSIYARLGYQGGYERVSNQMRVITSQNLIKQAISKLNLDVSYYINGRLSTKEVYEYLPFTVIPNKLKSVHYQKKINLRFVDDQHFEMWYEHNGAEYRDTYKFGKQLLDNGLYITVKKNRSLNGSSLEELKKVNYMFLVHNPQSLIRKYKRNTSVNNIEWTAIMEVTCEDVIPKRAIAFLDTLSSVYVDYTIQSQFDVNENTLKYIDRQLGEVTGILGAIEDDLENYKESKDILDLDREESRYFSELVTHEVQKRSIDMKLKALDDLEDYILNNRDDRLLPSSFYVDNKDDYLGQSLKKLYGMQIKRNAILFERKEGSVGMNRYDNEMDLLKKDILTYMDNTKEALRKREGHVEEKIMEYREMLKTIPKTQREILEIERKREVNEKMYLFLLEKRANTITARAGIVPETKVIESPHSIGRVKPDKQKIMYSFVLIGFVLSLLIGLGRTVLYAKIETVEELKSQTEIPVLGEIIDVKGNEELDLVVTADPKSPITESFRVIRTNLDYFVSKNTSKVILITSNNPGEGKTFCSVNLGTIFANAGKKVLVIEMDMHKPRVHKALNMQSDAGTSSFLIGKANFEQVVQKTNVPNLFTILSGPIPPNPSEIVLSEYLDDLLKNARKEFDYIFIDTPPVGLITDALVLMKKADINLFVLNTKVAKKKTVKNIEDIVDKINPDNVGLILNGVKKRKSGYYYKYYGYSYGYGEKS